MSDISRLLLGVDAGQFVQGLAHAARSAQQFTREMDNVARTTLSFEKSITPATDALKAQTATMAAAKAEARNYTLALNGLYLTTEQARTLEDRQRASLQATADARKKAAQAARDQAAAERAVSQQNAMFQRYTGFTSTRDLQAQIAQIRALQKAFGETSSEAKVLERSIVQLQKELNTDYGKGKKSLDEWLRSILNAKEGATGFIAEILRIGTSTYLIGRAIGALADLVKGAVGPLIESASAMEKMSMAYSVLAESPAGGQGLLNYITELSTKVPVTIDAFDKANRTLLGFGFTSKEIEPILLRLADVTQGNSENFAHLALVYGQVRAQGKAMQQDMYQFVNAGIPIMEALADVIGKPTAAIREMVREGEIGLDEFEQAIINLTSEGGRFYNFTKEASDTLSGQMTIAANNLKLIFADMGEGLVDRIKDAVKAANDGMKQLSEDRNLREVANTISKRLTGQGLGLTPTYSEFWGQSTTSAEYIRRNPSIGGPLPAGMDAGRAFSTVLEDIDRKQKELDEYMNTPRMSYPLRSLYENQLASMRALRDILAVYNVGARGQSALTMPKGSNVPLGGAGGTGGAKTDILDLYPRNIAETYAPFVYGQRTPWLTNVEYGQLPLGLVEGPPNIYPSPTAETYAPFVYGQRTPWLTNVEYGQLPSGAVEGTGGPMGPMFAQLQEMEKIWDDMWKSVGTGVMDTSISTFVEVMQDLGAGTLDAEAAFKKYMATITAQMAPMFIRAGLEMIAKGTPEAIAIGIGLLALGGISALASGALGAGSSSGVRYDYGALATTVNPYGTNVGSFANGGVFNSPSLSSYSNGVYNSPRFFAFANGGVFGEAGPEAIMPLARGANGKLGVMASGGVSVLVQNIDQSGRGVSITQEESTGPGGEKIIRNIIRDVVNETIASGKADSALRSRNLAASGARARS